MLDRLRLSGGMPERERARRRATALTVLSGFEQARLNRAVLVRTAEPFPVLIRTLDALHVASALLVRARYPALRFATAAAARRAFYEWQYSTDGGKTWVSAASTLKTTTTVAGLTPGASVMFRYRAGTKTGEGDGGRGVAQSPLRIKYHGIGRNSGASFGIPQGVYLPRMMQLLSPRPPETRRRAPSLIDVELAPAQRDAVTLPAGRSLLVLGEAGHGKTTVALHRVAHLWRSTRGTLRACVIVPTEGLERWLQPLLRKLGADVEVLAYERWAAMQARAAFRGLPRRESEDGTPGVARLKRHPALRTVLDELARQGASEHARRADLLHLFGDRALLDRVAAAAAGTVTPRMVDDVLEHTRVQFSRTAEQEWSHVTDRARLVAVDGLALDVGTASADARSIDTEDYAVLFELDRLRAASRGVPPAAPPAYDLVMLDEAQELAPLELALVGRSLAPGGTLVVAGDPAQQVDPSVTFTSWEATMRELGCLDHASVTLDVGYRCPADVVALARHVLDGVTPASSGPSVLPLEAPDEAALAAWMARELAVLGRRDRTATTAVICRSPLFARRLVERLRLGIPARLVLDGRFLVRGGVQVTTVDQVKGLEFDTVVVPDATAAAYPEEGAARRALYVAVTRTRHQLVVASVGERTRLLPRG